MKRYILIFLFILFLISNLFAFSVDERIPYRLYIGEDKGTDWIDIKSTGFLDGNGNYRIAFEDLSPIRAIYQDDVNKCLLIIKDNSDWYFSYRGGYLDYFLRKIPREEIKSYITVDTKLIYTNNR